MSYTVVQILIVGLIVTFSLVHVVRKIFPQTAHSVQARMAKGLRGTGVPAVISLGERLQPTAVPAKGCGEKAGCGSCNMCGTIAALTRDIPKPRA